MPLYKTDIVTILHVLFAQHLRLYHLLYILITNDLFFLMPCVLCCVQIFHAQIVAYYYSSEF